MDISGMSGTTTPPISAEELAALPPEFRTLLQSVIDHYERQIAELKAELQAVRKTPWNSSLPPSSEHPHAKAGGGGESADSPSADAMSAEKNAKSKRQRGGQKGHLKRERTLIPVEQCDEVVSSSAMKSCRAVR